MSGYWRSTTQSSYVSTTAGLHCDSTMPSGQLRYSILVIPSRARITDIGDIAREEDGRLRIDAGRMEEGVFYRFSVAGETFLARRFGKSVVVYKVFEDGSLSVVPLYELEEAGSRESRKA